VPPAIVIAPSADLRTQKTLARFALEAAATECALWLTSGTALTAWSLALGGDAGTVSSVQSLATAAQAMHLPAAMTSARSSRRRVALVALGAARLAWLPLVLVALSPLAHSAGRLALLVTAVASAVLTMFAQNAQGAWMGDVIPADVRGRFFGTRTWIAALGGSLAALVIATLLDRRGLAGGTTEDGRVPLPVMALVGLLVAGLGVVSVLLLRGAHEPSREHRALEPRAALALLSDPALRRFLRYQIAWGVAVAPGAAFFSMHVLQTMHGGYRLIAAHGIVLVIASAARSHA
jgi:hypothetical protein